MTSCSKDDIVSAFVTWLHSGPKDAVDDVVAYINARQSQAASNGELDIFK